MSGIMLLLSVLRLRRLSGFRKPGDIYLLQTLDAF